MCACSVFVASFRWRKKTSKHFRNHLFCALICRSTSTPLIPTARLFKSNLYGNISAQSAPWVAEWDAHGEEETEWKCQAIWNSTRNWWPILYWVKLGTDDDMSSEHGWHHSENVKKQELYRIYRTTGSAIELYSFFRYIFHSDSAGASKSITINTLPL